MKTWPGMTRWEIDWNGTPWQDDIFNDNEDMWTVWNAIVTLNVVVDIANVID
jgi:hypothetical protein